MKKDLTRVLACPVCRGELALRIEEEDGTEVITGALLCARCQVTYPIAESIPNLIPQNKPDKP